MKLAGTMRLPFVILAPACVLPGVATAGSSGASASWWEIALIFIGAILAHIGVNVLNEYHDFKSGLDATTKRTPFSGGSGTLQKHPELAGRALALGIGVTVVTAAIGLYFVVAQGPLLLIFGAIGVLAVVFYTPWIASNPVVCLLAPGIGFGTAMVLGTHVAMGAQLSGAAVAASFIPFFLVSNLLLLNQFPDIEQDRAVGRRNILIAYGAQKGAVVYVSFLALCYVAIVVSAIARILPMWSLLGLATLPLAAVTSRAALAHATNVEKLIPALGPNVIITLLTPVLMAIGIFVG